MTKITITPVIVESGETLWRTPGGSLLTEEFILDWHDFVNRPKVELEKLKNEIDVELAKLGYVIARNRS